MVTLATAHIRRNFPMPWPPQRVRLRRCRPGCASVSGPRNGYDVIANNYDALTHFIESRARAVQEPAT